MLVTVSHDRVFHSKRYGLWTTPTAATVSYLVEKSDDGVNLFQRSQEVEDSLNLGQPGDKSWAAGNRRNGFKVLARFFAANRQCGRRPEDLAMDREFQVISQQAPEPGMMQFPDDMFTELNQNVRTGRSLPSGRAGE